MVCDTRGNWSHAENNILQKLDVLTRVDAHGFPLFMNKQIGATRWIPKGYRHWVANDAVSEVMRLMDESHYD